MDVGLSAGDGEVSEDFEAVYRGLEQGRGGVTEVGEGEFFF